jgi:hypothetical protein
MKKIKTLNNIGYVLIVLQILSYLGNLTQEQTIITDKYELLGSYTGSNILLIIAIILFLKARSLRKKINKSNLSDTLIDSIGKRDN